MFVLCVSNRISMIFKWLSLVWKTWRKEPIIMIDPTIDLTQPLQSINVTNAIQILCPKHVFKVTPNKIRAIGLGIYYCLKCLKNCSCFKSFGGEWWVDILYRFRIYFFESQRFGCNEFLGVFLNRFVSFDWAITMGWWQKVVTFSIEYWWPQNGRRDKLSCCFRDVKSQEDKFVITLYLNTMQQCDRETDYVQKYTYIMADWCRFIQWTFWYFGTAHYITPMVYCIRIRTYKLLELVPYVLLCSLLQ